MLEAKSSGTEEITYRYKESTRVTHGKTALGRGVTRTSVLESYALAVAVAVAGTTITFASEAKSMETREAACVYKVSTGMIHEKQ